MADILDRETPVLITSDPPIFRQLVAEWERGAEILEFIHEFELARTAQPPVINVVVTDPHGFQSPGHFRIETGDQGKVTYVNTPPPEVTGRVMTATRPLRAALDPAITQEIPVITDAAEPPGDPEATETEEPAEQGEPEEKPASIEEGGE